MGGAPETDSQKPINRPLYRFFLETMLNAKIKIIAVWMDEKPFAVMVEHSNKKFPDRDYKPFGFNNKTFDFIQLLITDTLKSNFYKIPFKLLKNNQAVITYSSYSKNI